MKAGIVITTINDCFKLIASLHDNLQFYGHANDVEIFIIPDVKTPRIANSGVKIHVPTLDEQDKFIYSLGVQPGFIKCNSDHRRNVGYLMALADGCDFVISLDDDNYPDSSYDFFAHHSIVCENAYEDDWCSTEKWVNVCDLLATESRYPTRYARGFPYFARHKPPSNGHWFGEPIVRVNQGMWVGEPDYDAITWLAAPMKSEAVVGHITLGKESWSPINSQNTAVHRDLIPAYYFARSARYGDIAQGYFVQAVAKKMGWAVRFGSPVVDHRRNSHNYLADVAAEIPDIQILEELLPQLTQWTLKGSTVSDIYLDLAELIRAQNLPLVAEDMVKWTNMCKQIGVAV